MIPETTFCIPSVRRTGNQLNHMQRHIMYTLFVLTFLIIACGGDEKEEGVVLPGNLQIQATVSDTEPGKVSVVATAANAKFFSIDFGEPGSLTNSLDGTGTYTYASPGTYTIQVNAHATQAKYISATSQVVIVIPDGGVSGEGYTTPETYAGYTLVWRDEFSGESLNTSDWTFELGTGSNGWGNNELQYYRAENTTVHDGFLTITAKKENFSGREYTSSRLITRGKQEFQYGRVDIRAILPKGQGVWPALWMLGAGHPDVPWPACGEIDIMEKIGGTDNENKVYGTLHWEHNGSHACTCDKQPYLLPNGIFNDEFHVFTIIWDDASIKWYVDDQLFNTIDITPADLSEFHDKFFFIFNVAVGGNWPGSPDASTVFPQKMVVDYIRVFRADN